MQTLPKKKKMQTHQTPRYKSNHSLPHYHHHSSGVMASTRLQKRYATSPIHASLVQMFKEKGKTLARGVLEPAGHTPNPILDALLLIQSETLEDAAASIGFVPAPMKYTFPHRNRQTGMNVRGETRLHHGTSTPRSPQQQTPPGHKGAL